MSTLELNDIVLIHTRVDVLGAPLVLQAARTGSRQHALAGRPGHSHDPCPLSPTARSHAARWTMPRMATVGIACPWARFLAVARKLER